MKLKKKIVLLPGDGIGPEVTRAAASVLQECAREFQHQFDMVELPVGGLAIDKTGNPLPNETRDACGEADAIFLGAVGGPKWDSLPVGKRPESGLLDLRKGLGLYVNLRPVKVIEPLRGISPLKPERLGDLDIEIVRELAGGMYFGERGNKVEGDRTYRHGWLHSRRGPLAPALLGGQSQRAHQLRAVAPHGQLRGVRISSGKARAYVC